MSQCPLHRAAVPQKLPPTTTTQAWGLFLFHMPGFTPGPPFSCLCQTVRKWTLRSIVLCALYAVMQRRMQERCRVCNGQDSLRLRQLGHLQTIGANAASPLHAPPLTQALLRSKGAKPTILSLENCVLFPEMQLFGLYISKKRTRDAKQMGKCIQIHNKAKNSYTAIPDPIAFIDIFSCPPHTSPRPQPAPADCPLCAGDLFITLGFCSLPFTHCSAPACPLLHSKVVPSLACFS